MSCRFAIASLAVAFGFGALCPRAHEGPAHEIDELTEQMKVQGQSADLLVRRAIEYKVLGQLTDAAKDLERALELNEQSAAVPRELGQVYFSLGKTNEALTTVSRALRSSADPAEEASLFITRAGILRARREYAKALQDTNEAIRRHKTNVEWYLMRSQLQAALDLRAQRVKVLQTGLQETGSGLLLGEWIDSLIEDGQHSLAAEQIEKELGESRWQSSWLIRRGKLRLATGQVQDGRNDLLAAIDELNHRLSASAADALLLADRALAYDLLRKKDEARRDYRAARDKGLDDEWVRERIRALREPDKDQD